MTTLSKEEYLKRYLSGDAGDAGKEKKKKKKKDKLKALAPVRMRIIDNDADVPCAATETVKEVSPAALTILCQDIWIRYLKRFFRIYRSIKESLSFAVFSHFFMHFVINCIS
jgi:hypothetical protein